MDSQAVAPISAASGLPVTPPLSPDPPEALPMSTTDVSMARSPSIIFSQLPGLNQTQTQSPNQPVKRTPRRSGTTKSIGSNSIAQTEYIGMVLETIPVWVNLLAALFSWIILAGFLVLPSSFSTLEKIPGVRNVPLLTISFALCGIGATGLLYLWFRYHHNYLWLLNSIFIPGTFNGISGLISTFVNIYGPGKAKGQHVLYGGTTIATVAATGGCAVICGFLAIIYSIKKFLVKRQHHRISREMSESGDEPGPNEMLQS